MEGINGRAMTDEQEKEALGFRNPPLHVTRPCLYYMGRVMEQREFISFYFNFVKSSSEIGKAIAESNISEKNLSDNAHALVKYNFSDHRQFVNEIILSRSVESFDLYILNVLREIFQAKPDILKSGKKIDASTLLELRTPEEIIFYLAENQLNELGYKPLSELRKWIKNRTGLELFKSDEVFDAALLATEVRNLIAHNDCKTNDVIEKRIGERIEKLEISDIGKVVINDEWLRRSCYQLDGIVFDFDELVSEKFDVYKSNRFGAFHLR